MRNFRYSDCGLTSGAGSLAEYNAAKKFDKIGPAERLGKRQARQRATKISVIGDDVALAHARIKLILELGS